MLGQKTWDHSICDECWKAEEGDRTPVKLTRRDYEMCCWCGATHDSGIYRRHDQSNLLCAGTDADSITDAIKALLRSSFSDVSSFDELTEEEQKVVKNELIFNLIIKWAEFK